MHKVTTKDIPITSYQRGDLFRDVENNIYLLTNLGGNFYLAIRLKDGCTWNSPSDSIEGALAGGLVFFKRDAKITIE